MHQQLAQVGMEFRCQHRDNIKVQLFIQLLMVLSIFLLIMVQPGLKIQMHQLVVQIGVQYPYPHQDNTKVLVLHMVPSTLLQIMVQIGVKM